MPCHAVCFHSSHIVRAISRLLEGDVYVICKPKLYVLVLVKESSSKSVASVSPFCV